MTQRNVELSGWGRYPRIRGDLQTPRDETDLRQLLASPKHVIARGNGRSYGDASFNDEATTSMLAFNKLLAFDAETGVLTCDAGVILGDIIDALLPRGWFPPVSPGTKFVTLGGMIASNVHGKNAVKHGAIGDHIEWLDLMGADGRTRRCSSVENEQLFLDTVGGMGLTGIILRAAVRMMPVQTGWMKQTRTSHPNLKSVMDAFEASEDATYRVAWIDVLAKGEHMGRSIFDAAEHASPDDLPPHHRSAPFRIGDKRKITVPFAPPISPLNSFSVKAFNALYYRKGKASVGDDLVDWESFFYPLDALLHWNRIYGRRGFAQYQCVLPLEASHDGLLELLDAISSDGRGSFLAVLKRLGDTIGTLSFPMDGYTLALDFPWSTGTARLLGQLDEIVKTRGGRVYLTKDSRITGDTFSAMQPETAAFKASRSASKAATHFQSSQSKRLGL